MCGISGILHLGSEVLIERALIERVNDTLGHRGPDEAGIHIEPGVALGHRRLSIIDIATGQQPLFNEDGSVAVVFNGEIYNFRELAAELQAAGHRFRTHSDTEVIVHAWEQWGEACVERFRGMFGFAVWDRNKRQLFLARDRLGIKPIYYTLLSDGQFVFASELKALLAHPGLTRDLDPLAVEDYFAFGYVPEPRSILRGVYKLEMAHTLLLDQRRKRLPSSRPYWDIPFAPVDAGSFEQAQQELIERTHEAVQVRMLAEVPLGAFLSGGVDSSAVVALMSDQLQDPVKTCAIGFDVPGYDESAFAEQVAQRYHTDHQLHMLSEEQADLVDLMPGLFDEPFADASAMPTYRVCEAARKRVTVALSGDGGDESYAGYRRYRLHLAEEQVRNRLPLWLRRSLFGPLGQLYPKADWAPRVFRAKTTFQALARDTASAWMHSVSRMSDEDRRHLYSQQLHQELGGYHASEVMQRHAAQAPTDDPLSLVQYLDFKTFLVAVLHKVDRTSMAHALEVRVPLLDHHLVEWISGLPSQWKLKGGEGKYIFKKALEPHLPHDIMYRPKQGFSLPLAEWMRGRLSTRVQALVEDQRLFDTGLFQRQMVQRLVTQHLRGQRDNSTSLWELMMFSSSLQQLDGGA
jgi:asparagine synthase (glutamine-hydrolysing)